MAKPIETTEAPITEDTNVNEDVSKLEPVVNPTGNDAAKIAAWDEAVEQAPPEEGAPPKPEPKLEDEPGDEPPLELQETDEEKAAKDAEAKAAAAVDKEMADLKITNPKTQERFRELANKAVEYDKLQTEMPQMQERITRANEFEDRIIATGAAPEQFGRAMFALQAVNSDDPIMLGQLHDVLTEELALVAKRLGRPATGYNPLDDKGMEDLKAEVDAGELSEARALEMARLRRGTNMVTEHRQESVQATNATTEAVKAVAALGQDLRDLDPENFDARMALIGPKVQNIQRTLPPHQWASAIKEAYKATPAPAPARRPPSRIPARANAQGNMPASGVKAAPANAFDAFSQGVEEAESHQR